jgi:DNA-binding transcriptional regulator YiaG
MGYVMSLIKQTRHVLGLTQVQLATLLGASQPRVSAWESGERRLPNCQRRLLLVLARLHETEPGAIDELLIDRGYILS